MCVQKAGGANPSPVAPFGETVNPGFLIAPVAEDAFAEKNIPVGTVDLVSGKHDALWPDAKQTGDTDSALQVGFKGSFVLPGLRAVIVGKCVRSYFLPWSPLERTDDAWCEMEGIDFFGFADRLPVGIQG
jgi:hypothetical protein